MASHPRVVGQPALIIDRYAGASGSQVNPKLSHIRPFGIESTSLLLVATRAVHPGIECKRARRKDFRRRRLSLAGQLRGQLLCLDFGYHIAIKEFRGFLVSPRPTI
jgi:hypothetical protein